MRKFLIAALASTAIATPAVALDNAFYVGVEGGLMIVEDTELDLDTVDEDDEDVLIGDAVVIDHKTGLDVDLIAGYDFGAFRAEGELAYKRASLDEIALDPALTFPAAGGEFDADGRVSVLSAMLNLLLDFGDDSGWSGYLGAGAGFARVKYNADIDGLTPAIGFSDSDSSFAWQGIAGVRMAISPTMDLGLKYRFFNAKNVRFEGADGTVPFDLDGRFRSHSLLASLIFNFAPPPPPPPPPVVVETPPPPPPATQTCPDGSVILATDTCPVPPPPPPPPPPEPIRG